MLIRSHSDRSNHKVSLAVKDLDRTSLTIVRDVIGNHRCQSDQGRPIHVSKGLHCLCVGKLRLFVVVHLTRWMAVVRALARKAVAAVAVKTQDPSATRSVSE